MAAPRPIRWVLQAKDQTGNAFRSVGRKIGNLGRAANQARLGLLALGAGAVAAIAKVVGLASTIDNIRISFFSTTAQVDRLGEAFGTAGLDMEEMRSMLSALRVASDEARSGNVEMAQALKQFKVDPNNLNTVSQLVDLLDEVNRQGAGVRTDILARLVGEDAVGRIRQINARVGDLRTFMAGITPLSEQAGETAAETRGLLSRAGRGMTRRFAERFRDIAPFVNLPLRAAAGRPLEEITGGFRQDISDVRAVDVFKRAVTLLESIDGNTREQGKLGR